MTLGERIKECRQRSGMSQEKVAELIGVSRQAVTKWEADISMPNTDNLFRLAEIFGTTADTLMNGGGTEQTTAEQLYAMYKADRERSAEERRCRLRRNMISAGITTAVYLCVYLIGRLVWCDISESSFLGWLFIASPKGEHSYLYGWLLSSNMFWLAMIVSVIPALFGKYRFSFITVLFFVIGLAAGILLGPYPAGEAYGQGDYGWAILGAIYLLSLIVGIIIERTVKKRIC